MKILSLHCDYINFKPLKKALKQPEELSDERKKEISIKEPLVIFTAVEKKDEDIVKELILPKDNLVERLTEKEIKKNKVLENIK